jgi:hypothetical protein
VTIFLTAAFGTIAAVIAEIVVPGQAAYHSGWYNVALAALLIIAVLRGRRAFVQTPSTRARVAILTVICGAAIAGLAGVASGLLAPDNQTYVGAPGERVRIEGLGTLVFPLAAQTKAGERVTLERDRHAPLDVSGRSRDAGRFILRTVPRSVVYVEARDLRGNRLTVTQPSGSVFLSPVLLMEHQQSIAGLDLPYDSFNVPAARRVVKVVAFTPEQAAMMLHGAGLAGEPSVLFAVDDENERPLAHAIALSAGGRSVRAGDLSLRGTVGDYPAVEVVAAPDVLAAALGALLVLAGSIGLISA